jgi:hypothetical protein
MNLDQAANDKSLEILGTMPAYFKERLIKAINSSVRTDARKKERILKILAQESNWVTTLLRHSIHIIRKQQP